MTKATERLSKTVMVISLSLNVFVFASLAMYGTWLATAVLDDFWRGVTALSVWIGTFGVSTLAFWKIVQQISAGAINA